MKIIKPLIVSLLAMFSTAMPSVGQNTALSPYTRYGYGNLSDNATAAQRSMGGVGYAMHSGRQINVMNPASYASIDSLTFLFDMGADFTSMWSKEGELRENQLGGGLDYITMQVPIGRYMGASLGLLPYGSVGYSFGSSIENGYSTRSGSGSINQLYLGLGAKPFKGFSVGFNIAYLFGSTTNDLYANTIYGSTSLFERSMTVRDWRMDIGVQYTVMLNARNRLNLGFVFAPGKDLHGHVYGVYYDTSVKDVVPDTVNAGDTSMKGRYSLPPSYGAGIGWEWDKRLLVEADFTYQPWAKAKYASIENFEATQLADRWRVGLGAQFTPSLRGSYLSRIQYRFGGFFNRDYVMVGTNHVRDYGLSAGFGFPVPGFKTIVNLGFEWRHRQAYPASLVQENYLNITLGINFNEMWFRKNRLY